jgi:hypothetical protein
MSPAQKSVMSYFDRTIFAIATPGIMKEFGVSAVLIGAVTLGTIAGVAQKLGVHRRMVREAIGSALPKPRKKTERPHQRQIASSSADYHQPIRMISFEGRD